MLDPMDRNMFTEALRPPVGFSLDCTVATTYTLDLASLLVAPLSFTVFDWDETEHFSDLDPIALLDALRQYSDRMSLFCQAGRIRIPPSYNRLFSYLESSVHEVNLSREGASFHPKVWVLRFVGESGEVWYRLLVMSRNLTFDHSWDMMLVLGGQLRDRVNAYSRNHPLGNLVETLSTIATEPLDDTTQRRVDRVQYEIRRVQFDLPDGFTDYRFWAPGAGKTRTWPFSGRRDRVLVISPFVSSRLLARLAGQGEEHILVSEPESIADTDPEVRERFKQIYMIGDDPAVMGAGPDEAEAEEEYPEDGELRGLHGKMFVADAGRSSRLWVGSANATYAAFHGNVEFLVELHGTRYGSGVDACLQSASGDVCFQDILVPYAPTDEDESAREDELDRRLEAGRRALIDSRPQLEVRTGEGQDDYCCDIQFADLQDGLQDVKMHCWPVTLDEQTGKRRLQPEGEPAARFFVSLLSLTRFVAFDMHLNEGENTAHARFVLNLPVWGMPDGRERKILAHILEDQEGVLRYLLMLLTGTDLSQADGESLLQEFSGGWDAARRHGGHHLPLLETMLQTLDREPERLDRVAHLLEDLRKESPELLPSDMEPVWEVIWSVRRELETKE